MERENRLLDDYVLSLASRARPHVCFLPTASGDADHYVVRFYRRFSASCEASHVSLFSRDQGTGGVEDDLAPHLLAQDVIYVGGGNVVSMLGAWRAHGLDAVLARAWRKGIVLCGPSAGSLCWFRDALSAFHGSSQRVRGLGLLPYSNCVHYDAEPERRAEYHRFVGDGMRPGFAAEDGVGPAFPRHPPGARRQLAPRRTRIPRGARRGWRRRGDPARGRLPRRRADPCWARGRVRGRVSQPAALAAPRDRRIFAMGGGGFTMEPANPLLDDYVLVARVAPSAPASCSCQPPPATRPGRSTPSTRASPAAAAFPSISRCFAWPRSSARSRRSC